LETVEELAMTIREMNIIEATLAMRVVNTQNEGCVPDFDLFDIASKYNLTMEDIRWIRDIVQNS
jgi:hypothetical protein